MSPPKSTIEGYVHEIIGKDYLLFLCQNLIVLKSHTDDTEEDTEQKRTQPTHEPPDGFIHVRFFRVHFLHSDFLHRRTYQKDARTQLTTEARTAYHELCDTRYCT